MVSEQGGGGGNLRTSQPTQQQPLHIAQNTPVSLGKSKSYSQFRNANPETQ